MAKQIEYNMEARRKLKNGVDSLARAVIVTLGPRGRSVVYEKSNGLPQVSNDGVSVARQVELEDPVENLGVKMIREAAVKTSEAAGDGTTTATLFAQVLIDAGLKRVEAGLNPVELRKGIDKAVKAVIAQLREQAIPIEKDQAKIEQVAAISANNDKSIGKLIADAVIKAGSEGVITIEEAKGMETSIEMVEGMQFDRGYLSPYFVTDTEKMEVHFENPYLLLYDQKISTMTALVPLLDKVIQTGKPILVMAEDVEGEALAVLVVNRLRGALKIAAVKAPGFGERRKEQLEDLAVLTGGVVISEEKGLKLENVDLSHLGTCEKAVVTKENTTVVHGYGDEKAIQGRIQLIKNEIKNATSDYDQEKLQQRLAKLSGGVAVVYVGAPTEVEMNEKKDKVDDALSATRAAMEEGIVPGGGVSYIRATSALDKLETDSDDERSGVEIVRKILDEPLRRIVLNAGLEEAEIMYRVKAGTGDFGFNAKSEKFENLLQTGIIDPVKVNRLALEYAASVAGMFLITECVIVEKPEKKRILNAQEAAEVM